MSGDRAQNVSAVIYEKGGAGAIAHAFESQRDFDESPSRGCRSAKMQGYGGCLRDVAGPARETRSGDYPVIRNGVQSRKRRGHSK